MRGLELYSPRIAPCAEGQNEAHSYHYVVCPSGQRAISDCCQSQRHTQGGCTTTRRSTFNLRHLRLSSVSAVTVCGLNAFLSALSRGGGIPFPRCRSILGNWPECDFGPLSLDRGIPFPRSEGDDRCRSHRIRRRSRAMRRPWSAVRMRLVHRRKWSERI